MFSAVNSVTSYSVNAENQNKEEKSYVKLGAAIGVMALCGAATPILVSKSESIANLFQEAGLTEVKSKASGILTDALGVAGFAIRELLSERL